MASFNLIGFYKIIPTQESIVLAAKFHEYDWLINGEGEYVEKIDITSLINLYLFEFQVAGIYSPNELLEIKQGDQSPYLEYYTDPTGENYLNENDAIHTDNRRVCFFLHFVDITKPLQVKGKITNLPIPKQLPNRLEPFTHYVPVD